MIITSVRAWSITLKLAMVASNSEDELIIAASELQKHGTILEPPVLCCCREVLDKKTAITPLNEVLYHLSEAWTKYNQQVFETFPWLASINLNIFDSIFFRFLVMYWNPSHLSVWYFFTDFFEHHIHWTGVPWIMANIGIFESVDIGHTHQWSTFQKYLGFAVGGLRPPKLVSSCTSRIEWYSSLNGSCTHPICLQSSSSWLHGYEVLCS